MNENGIENQLRRLLRVQPSPHLDQRLNMLFRETGAARSSILMRSVPAWMVTAACLVCTVAGLGTRSLFIPGRNPPTVVYVLPPNEALTRFLAGPKASRRDNFDFSRARVEVIQPPAPQGGEL